MQRYKITLVGDRFHIEGFPDAVKAISLATLTPHLSRQIADYVLHRDDLSFAKECTGLLLSPGIDQPVVRQALWRSAIVYYCKCFDKSGKIRSALSYTKYLPSGNARICHQYFVDLRNKHLVHDENSYTQASTGAVIASEGKAEKVEEVICMNVVGATLNDENLNTLHRLIIEALVWVESRFDELSAKIKVELEKQSYETLLAQPDMAPYRAPTVDEVSIPRQREL